MLNSSLDTEKVKQLLNCYNRLDKRYWLFKKNTELALKKRIEQSKSIVFIKTVGNDNIKLLF